jgi:Mg2+/citrate symporter
MDGNFQTRVPSTLAKLGVRVLAFVLLGVGYSYPELVPTLVVGAVAVMVLVVWLGLRQSRR